MLVERWLHIRYIGKGCGFWEDEEQRMDWPRIFSSGHVLGPNLRIFIYMCVCKYDPSSEGTRTISLRSSWVEKVILLILFNDSRIIIPKEFWTWVITIFVQWVFSYQRVQLNIGTCLISMLIWRCRFGDYTLMLPSLHFACTLFLYSQGLEWGTHMNDQ